MLARLSAVPLSAQGFKHSFYNRPRRTTRDKERLPRIKLKSGTHVSGRFFPLELGTRGLCPFTIHSPSFFQLSVLLGYEERRGPGVNPGERKMGALSPAQACHLQPAAVPSPPPTPGCRDEGEASISGQRWEEGQALMLCKGAVWRSLGSWASLPYCSSPLYLPPPPRDTRTWREGKWTERRLERRSHPPGDQTLLRPRDLPSSGGGHRRC